MNPSARAFRRSRRAAILRRNQKQEPRKSPAKSRHAWPSPAGGDSMKRALKDFVKTLGISAIILAAASAPTLAQKKYDTGVTDTEIKIGNIMPYSGPASAYGIIGKNMSAY